jgi:hypothetical protein
MHSIIYLFSVVFSVASQCPEGSTLDFTCTLLEVGCTGLCRNSTNATVSNQPLIQKPFLIEGDILPDRDMVLGNKDKKIGNALRDRRFLWLEKVVPVTIRNDYSYDEYQTILNALRILERFTCIKFTNYTDQQNSIEVYRGPGCFSNVGKTGGKQYLSLGNGCVYVGTVMHEFMHALGFYHEQSRTDRDDFIYIAWQNIYQGMEHNFDKYSKELIDNLGQPYDYQSLMHYTKDAFSKNGQPTIIPRKNVELIHSAYKYVPSDIDVAKLRSLYGCATCSDKARYCSVWASSGYCSTGGIFMSIGCAASCNTCHLLSYECKDYDSSCANWRCGTEYVDAVCQKKCNTC